MQIYKDILNLAKTKPQAHEIITQAIKGSKWTLVATSEATGLAMSVLSHKAQNDFFSPINLSLYEVASFILDWDFNKASFAMAALNCIFNREAEAKKLNLHKKTDLLASLAKDSLVVSVGDFPFLRNTDLKNLVVLERDFNKGTHPDSALEEFLPKANTVIITGSSLINKTFPRIIELSKNATNKILIGPSTPLIPELLSYLTKLGVLVIHNHQKGFELVALGASSQLFDQSISHTFDLV